MFSLFSKKIDISKIKEKYKKCEYCKHLKKKMSISSAIDVFGSEPQTYCKFCGDVEYWGMCSKYEPKPIVYKKMSELKNKEENDYRDCYY